MSCPQILKIFQPCFLVERGSSLLLAHLAPDRDVGKRGLDFVLGLINQTLTQSILIQNAKVGATGRSPLHLYGDAQKHRR